MYHNPFASPDQAFAFYCECVDDYLTSLEEKSEASMSAYREAYINAVEDEHCDIKHSTLALAHEKKEVMVQALRERRAALEDLLPYVEAAIAQSYAWAEAGTPPPRVVPVGFRKWELCALPGQISSGDLVETCDSGGTRYRWVGGQSRTVGSHVTFDDAWAEPKAFTSYRLAKLQTMPESLALRPLSLRKDLEEVTQVVRELSARLAMLEGPRE